jgi:hypothetical protein
MCTSISPPCVPAKMYCEDTASASMDLSCFMRCESVGIRSAVGTCFSAPLVSMASSLCRGAATGMVSLAHRCPFGVPAWSRVIVRDSAWER